MRENMGAHTPSAGAPSVTIIRPAGGWAPLEPRELWEARELLSVLVARDIKARYRQTTLGAAWAVLQPFLAMVVFSIFFGRLIGISSEGVPYPVFAYSALVPWTYFASALGLAANSLVDNEQTLTKVYFPRLLVPATPVLAKLLDFGIAFAILVGMMLFYGVAPTAAVWTLPLFVLLAAVTALGVGVWLSALTIVHRDIRHVVPFLVQLWLFATPVAYSSSLIPERWRALYGLNPMAGVVEGFRWALLGRAPASAALLAVSTLTVVALLVSGLYYFRRVERTFVDVV